MTKRAKRLWMLTGAIVHAALLAVIAAGPIMTRVEQPEYQVGKADGAFELRTYPPMIAAEVDIS